MGSFQRHYSPDTSWRDRFDVMGGSSYMRVDEFLQHIQDVSDPQAEKVLAADDDHSLEEVIDGQAPLMYEAILRGRDLFAARYQVPLIDISVPVMGQMMPSQGALVNEVIYVFHEQWAVGFCLPHNIIGTMTHIDHEIELTTMVGDFMRCWRDIGALGHNRVGIDFYYVMGGILEACVTYAGIRIFTFNRQSMIFADSNEERVALLKERLSARVVALSSLDFLELDEDCLLWPEFHKGVDHDPYGNDAIHHQIMSVMDAMKTMSLYWSHAISIACLPGLISPTLTMGLPSTLSVQIQGHEKEYMRWLLDHAFNSMDIVEDDEEEDDEEDEEDEDDIDNEDC